MSNVLKCNVCNIVIDEMLSYIQNKLSVIDEITLVRICSTAFDSEEIKHSKSLLFDSVPTEHRKIRRKNKGKELRDLEDIITLLKSTDPDVIPVFVARRLEKLPPITFDHLDCTKLLKDLTRLQNDIENVKLSYVTHKELEAFRMELDKLKYVSLPSSPQFRNINSMRGAWNADSGPIGLSFYPEQSEKEIPSVQSKSSTDSEKPKQSKSGCQDMDNNLNSGYLCDSRSGEVLTAKSAEMVTKRASAPTSPSSRPPPSPRLPPSPRPPRTAAQPAGSLNQQVSGGSKLTSVAREQSVAILFTSKSECINTDNEGWQQVMRKKRSSYRYRGQMGVASELNGRFKAAEKRVPIFISNVHKDTSENDITEYIQSKTQESVSLKKIDTKKLKYHHAYKFFVSVSKMPLFLDEKLWPEGIIFRRFVHFKQKSMHRNSLQNGHQNDD